MRYYLLLFFITNLVYAFDIEHLTCHKFLTKLMQITEINTINKEVSKYDAFNIDDLPFFNDNRELYFSMIPLMGQINANEKKKYSNYPVKIQSIIRSMASIDKVNQLLSIFKRSKVLQADPISKALFEHLKKNKTTIIKSLKNRKIKDVLKVLYPEGIISFYNADTLYSAKQITYLLTAVDPDLWGNILNKADISTKENLKIMEDLSSSGYSYRLNRLTQSQLRRIFISILLRNINTEIKNDQINEIEASILKSKKVIQDLYEHIDMEFNEAYETLGTLKSSESLLSQFRAVSELNYLWKMGYLTDLNIETIANRTTSIESKIVLEFENIHSLIRSYDLFSEEYFNTPPSFYNSFFKRLLFYFTIAGVTLFDADLHSFAPYSPFIALSLDILYSLMKPSFLDDVDSLL